MDCTQTYEEAKAKGHSFYLSYLHKALVAANEIEAFRLRIHEDSVWLYDHIHAAPTVDRPDHTFGYGYLDYHADFADFVHEALPRIEEVRRSKSLLPSASGDNVIHFFLCSLDPLYRLISCPATDFSRQYPQDYLRKMEKRAGSYTMPLSVHVHHGLADGYQVGQYIDRYQTLLST